MMLTASAFCSAPDGEIAACIIHGCVRYCFPNNYEAQISTLFPSVLLSPKPTISLRNRQTLFKSHVGTNDSKLDIFRDIWYQRGLKYALEEMLSYELGGSMTSGIINILLRITNYCSPLIGAGKPTVNMDLFRECTLARDWTNSLVRCVVWHPYDSQFAVVLSNDYVEIYTCGNVNSQKLVHHLQNNVTSIAFRPLSKRDIAVGCAAGVFIWTVSGNSLIDSPSLNSSMLLNNQKYVTSVAWNDRGKLLVTCSVFDHSIYVWDISLRTNLIISGYGIGNSTLVSWSPDSKYVFSNTTRGSFRILFADDEWQYEKLSTKSPRIAVVCWSPCSKYVLYSAWSESLIYLLSITSDADATVKFRISTLADLAIYELPASGDIFGGEILQMVWDQKGIYLAVTFKKTNLIALFNTVISATNVQLTSRCVIKGQPSEEPIGISFQNEFREGANLLIIWSSGRIQYFPCFQKAPYHHGYMPPKWRLNNAV